VLKLGIISYYRVIIYLEGFLVSFRGFFWRLYFAWWNIWISIILLFALLRYFFNVNGKAIVWHTPCWMLVLSLSLSPLGCSFHFSFGWVMLLLFTYFARFHHQKFGNWKLNECFILCVWYHSTSTSGCIRHMSIE